MAHFRLRILINGSLCILVVLCTCVCLTVNRQKERNKTIRLFSNLSVLSKASFSCCKHKSLMKRGMRIWYMFCLSRYMTNAFLYGMSGIWPLIFCFVRIQTKYIWLFHERSPTVTHVIKIIFLCHDSFYPMKLLFKSTNDHHLYEK